MIRLLEFREFSLSTLTNLKREQKMLKREKWKKFKIVYLNNSSRKQKLLLDLVFLCHFSIDIDLISLCKEYSSTKIGTQSWLKVFITKVIFRDGTKL